MPGFPLANFWLDRKLTSAKRPRMINLCRGPVTAAGRGELGLRPADNQAVLELGQSAIICMTTRPVTVERDLTASPEGRPFL